MDSSAGAFIISQPGVWNCLGGNITQIPPLESIYKDFELLRSKKAVEAFAEFGD